MNSHEVNTSPAHTLYSWIRKVVQHEQWAEEHWSISGVDKIPCKLSVCVCDLVCSFTASLTTQFVLVLFLKSNVKIKHCAITLLTVCFNFTHNFWSISLYLAYKRRWIGNFQLSVVQIFVSTKNSFHNKAELVMLFI